MQSNFEIYFPNLLIVVKLNKALTIKNVMFLNRTLCSILGCLSHPRFVDVSSGFLNALSDVKMYGVYDDVGE